MWVVEEASAGPVQFVQSAKEEAQDQCSQAQKHLPWASLLEGEELTYPREAAPSLHSEGLYLIHCSLLTARPSLLGFSQ